ncbi:hypothetical protein ACLOJK_020425 [Asimina triloba]
MLAPSKLNGLTRLLRLVSLLEFTFNPELEIRKDGLDEFLNGVRDDAIVHRHTSKGEIRTWHRRIATYTSPHEMNEPAYTVSYSYQMDSKPKKDSSPSYEQERI